MMLTSLGEHFFSRCFEWLSFAWQFSSHSSGSLRFLNITISQGSVATRLRCGGIFKYSVTRNLPLSLSVKEVCKSVSIWFHFFRTRCTYRVPAQETAKHRAKFGWPPVSDVAAVMKARRERGWHLLNAVGPNRENVAVMVTLVQFRDKNNGAPFLAITRQYETRQLCLEREVVKRVCFSFSICSLVFKLHDFKVAPLWKTPPVYGNPNLKKGDQASTKIWRSSDEGGWL